MCIHRRLGIENLETRRLFVAPVMHLQMIPNVGTGRYDFQPMREATETLAASHETKTEASVEVSAESIDVAIIAF